MPKVGGARGRGECTGFNLQHESHHCEGCKYDISLTESGHFKICGYMYVEGKCRGCEAGKGKCYHYEEGELTAYEKSRLELID